MIKNFLLALALSAVMLMGAPAGASPWPTAHTLMESVVFIETEGGSCTGFVINTEKHYILTAAHCDGKKIYADGVPARIVQKDVKSDLMVLAVGELNRPALPLASKSPDLGEVVASVGYGYGLERPMFRVTHISDDRAQVPELSGTFIMVDTAFAPGQSGGPLINEKGEVVAIVQMANDRLGLGRGPEYLKDKVGKYFQTH